MGVRLEADDVQADRIRAAGISPLHGRDERFAVSDVIA
jgi:hypothetical protein